MVTVIKAAKDELSSGRSAQGLALVHVSAQRKRFLWDTFVVSVINTAQGEVRSGRVEAPTGSPPGIDRTCDGCGGARPGLLAGCRPARTYPKLSNECPGPSLAVGGLFTSRFTAASLAFPSLSFAAVWSQGRRIVPFYAQL